MNIDIETYKPTYLSDYLSGQVSSLAYVDIIKKDQISDLSTTNLSIFNNNEISTYLLKTTLPTYKLSTFNNNEISTYLLSSTISGTIALCTDVQLKEAISTGSTKVWIDNQVSNIAGYSELSIIDLPISSFELCVLGGTILSNQLFVLDDNYIDAFGQQICALTMNNSNNDEVSYRGIAATDKYVDSKVNDLKDSLKTFFTEMSSTIKEQTTFEGISCQLLNAISVLCENL